jgi:hypothetical protein
MFQDGSNSIEVELTLKKQDNVISSELAQRKETAMAKEWVMTTQVQGWGSPTISPIFPSVIVKFRGNPLGGLVGAVANQAIFLVRTFLLHTETIRANLFIIAEFKMRKPIRPLFFSLTLPFSFLMLQS